MPRYLLHSFLFLITSLISPSYSVEPLPKKSPNLFKQAEILREDLQTLGAHMNAEAVTSTLRKLVNDELGVPTMQAIIDGLSFLKIAKNRTAIVENVAAQLDETLARYDKVLRASRDAALTYHKKHPLDMHVFNQFRECCRLDIGQLRFEAQFEAHVNFSFSCDIATPSEPTFLFHPGQNLTSMYHQNVALLSGLRWQYLLGVSGAHLIYPANSSPLSPSFVCPPLHTHHHHHHSVFLSSALPYPKRVVILIDYGGVVDATHLNNIRSMAEHWLDSFSKDDRITVLTAVGDKVSKLCENEEFAQLLEPTEQHRTALKSLLTSMMPFSGVRTNHSLALSQAFRVLVNAQNSLSMRTGPTAYNFILYISRGFLSSLAEAGQVLATLAELNVNTFIDVQINSFVITDEDKTPPLWAAQFLKDVAEQNFNKYRHSLSDELLAKLERSKVHPPRGKLIPMTGRTVSIGSLYSALKKPLSSSSPSRTSWSSLHSNSISMSLPVLLDDGRRLIGVVGQDISLDVVADNVLFPSDVQPLLLVHSDGRLIFDSRLGVRSLWPVSLSEREGWSRDDQWKARFDRTNEDGGTFRTTVRGVNASREIVYEWSRLSTGPFVVLHPHSSSARASIDFHLSLPAELTEHAHPLRNVVYHRLDLHLNRRLQPWLCIHHGRLSTFSKGGVYLGPSCFVRPNGREQTSRAAGYWVYLDDGAGLISNTGVRQGVRQDVRAVAEIVDVWKQADRMSSRFRRNILRRFVATGRGVLVTYPATVFDDDFDPTTRDWYTRALLHPGRIVLTGPRLDSAAGQIVTISHTIFEGRKASMHLPTDRVFAVVAMEMSVDLLTKLLRRTLSICRQPNRRCLLFEDGGYLLALNDPLLNGATSADDSIDRGVRQPIERMHLTYREPILAIHLMQNRQFMKKIVCRHWQQESRWRLYKLNVSYSDAIRLEDTPVCEPDQPLYTAPTWSQDVFIANNKDADPLPQCIAIRCADYSLVDACLGVLGCQWCVRTDDGSTPLSRPFCAPIDRCFDGVLGRPIVDHYRMFILLVVAVSCYRHQMNRLVQSRASGGSGVRLFPVNDRDDFQFDHNGSKNECSPDGRPSSILQLASFERHSLLSRPIFSSSRTAPRTESSDNGYSTMTDRVQGEDSTLDPLLPSTINTDECSQLKSTNKTPFSLVVTTAQVHSVET